MTTTQEKQYDRKESTQAQTQLNDINKDIYSFLAQINY